MATSLADAYVQIIPSAKGIQGSIANVLNNEANSAGLSAGNTIASKIKGIIAAAGIGRALKESIMEGADLQQSLGGIETLFKDSNNIVIENAKNAYKTAGMSANAYMETVTGFSASLLQSLGNDTKLAADIADMALTDMSDNANKMGTDMESIKYAYQGFAKQNYTMLDNLKLGYGGTKTEMERLLADATKLSGVQYDISSLSDVYNAIHVIQEEMGITGTTAKEAATTYTGSFSAMRAAIDNAFGNMALGEKIDFDGLANSVSTFVFDNFLPMIGNIVTSLPDIAAGIATHLPMFLERGQELLSTVVSGIVESIPEKLPEALAFVQQLGDDIAAKAPEFIEKGFQILSEVVSGIVSAIPILIQRVPEIVSTFANVINDNFPTILKKGVELLWQLITGIISSIPTLIENIPKIITAIIDTLMAFNWLNLGKNIMTFFKDGIANMIPQIKTAGQNIFNAIKDIIAQLPSNLLNLGKSAMSNLGNAISSMKSFITTNALKIVSGIESTLLQLPSKVLSIGQNIISGLWNGIASGWSWLLDMVANLANSIFQTACNALGIHSPSTKFEWIAEMAGAGYERGNKKQTPKLISAVKSQQDSIVRAAEETASSKFISGVTETAEKIVKIIVPVQIDGREIARSSAEYTSEQLVWEAL